MEVYCPRSPMPEIVRSRAWDQCVDQPDGRGGESRLHKIRLFDLIEHGAALPTITVDLHRQRAVEEAEVN